MFQHDFGFGVDRLLATLHISAQFLLCLFGVKFRVFGDRLFNLVIAFIGRVIGKNIENEPLFNRLFHAIQVKRHKTAIGLLLTKLLKRRIFWCGGKRQIGGIAPHFA